jgi:adenylate cyclase
MLKDEHFHYLIRATYQPRVVASTLAVLITLSQYIVGNDLHPSILVLICAVLMYPHISYWVSGIWFNKESTSSVTMIFDGVVVGAMIAANGFFLFTTITLLAALVFSTAVIAKPKILAKSLLGLAIVVTVAWYFGVPIRSSGSDLTNALCSLFFLVYTTMIAYQVFNMTSRLRQTRQKIALDNHTLSGITQHLRRYISPQLFAQITLQTKMDNKTNRKRLTVFFSDIEGFTELMDNLEEETVTHILNEYLNSMADIAIKYGGTIDKFMGDGIMIFFGDPHTKGAREDALACVRMSLEMGQRLKRLRTKWQAAGIFSELHMRIGINTGYCAVGNFGSENRMDYTAVGSTVNLASRLEGCAGRDSILISNGTYRLVLAMIDCHEQVPVRVKGINRSIQNYLVLGERKDSKMAVISKEGTGFSISMNPTAVDIVKARELMKEIDQSLLAIERHKNESTANIRLLN